MSEIVIVNSKPSIPWCISCVGFNPSDAPSLVDFWKRLKNPNRAVAEKLIQHKHHINEYKNKSCMMCGRTYDDNGICDETYKLTAERVKEELNNAGLFGVDDKKVEAIVATCKKSFNKLLEKRFHIPQDQWQYLTFSGCLAYMITVAQETKRKKNGIPDYHGPVNL